MAWMILVGYISKNLSAHTHTRWIGHTSHISYLTCWPLWLRVTTSLRWGFLNVFLLGFFMAHLSYGFFPVYGTLDSAVDRWYGRRVWAIQNLGIWVLETRYPKTHGRSSPIINFLIKSHLWYTSFPVKPIWKYAIQEYDVSLEVNLKPFSLQGQMFEHSTNN